MRRQDPTALAFGRPPKRTEHDDARSVLAQLLRTAEGATAALEAEAVFLQTDASVERWNVARSCAGELSMLTAAVGLDESALRRPLKKTAVAPPGSRLAAAYQRALESALPRTIRVVLEAQWGRLRRTFAVADESALAA